MDDKIFDPRIDAALNEVPLAKLPQGFVQGVMTPIRREEIQPARRFDFNRYAIPVFLVSFVVLLASAGTWFFLQFDPQRLGTAGLDLSRLAVDLPLPLIAVILASILICCFVTYSGFLSFLWLVNETG